MRKNKGILVVLQLLAIVIALVGFYIFLSSRDFRVTTDESPRLSTSSSSVAVTSSSSSSNKEATDASLPDVSPDDWELVLVNRDYAFNNVVPELGYVEGIPVDQRIVETTTQFMAAVHALDADPLQRLYSGYRSVEEQAALFQTRVAELVAGGTSEEEATAIVSQTVLPAGHSEHHTGLAIDIMRHSDVAKEIAAMAPEHGFILRYTAGSEHITGVSEENWHYRYVGVASAKYMTEHQLTLEEYLDLLRSQNR